MPDITEDAKTYVFTDREWHNITALFGAGIAVTLRNLGGDSISVFFTEDTTLTPTDKYLMDNCIDPVEIGGILFETTSSATDYVWCKASTGVGNIIVRKYGTLDPSEDITYLAQAISVLTKQLNDHEQNQSNSHKVTKEQVGLGNIPNAVTDDPTTNDSDILPTTKATFAIKEIIDTHKNDKNNPHGVTAGDIGLGDVANYAIATPEEAKAGIINNRMMTPMLTKLAIDEMVIVPISIAPQTILRGKMLSRPSNWSKFDCSAPVSVIEKNSATTVKVIAGLQVAFADDGSVKKSDVLVTDEVVSLPPNPTNGFHYISVLLDKYGHMTGFSTSNARPEEGVYLDGYNYDYFDHTSCTMRDYKGTSIRKVYIGKVFVTDTQITITMSTPLGKEYIQPVTSDQVLGGRELLMCPYSNYTNVIAEVEYNGLWGESYWNDQIGVKASSYSADRMNYVVLQNGLMGFLACGNESGSSFATSFASITTPLRTRLVFTKKF